METNLNMSHSVSSKPNLKDPRVVCRAFEALGWKIRRDGTRRMWSSADSQKRFDFVAINPEVGYDIGLVIAKDGTVSFEHESMTPVDSIFGTGFSKLKQEFSRIQVLDQVEARGGTCQIEKLANGTLHLDIEVEVFA
jgi:hypothetical protein